MLASKGWFTAFLLLYGVLVTAGGSRVANSLYDPARACGIIRWMWMAEQPLFLGEKEKEQLETSGKATSFIGKPLSLGNYKHIHHRRRQRRSKIQ